MFRAVPAALAYLLPVLVLPALADPLPAMWQVERERYQALYKAACGGDRAAYNKLKKAAEVDRSPAAMNSLRITHYVKKCGYGDGESDYTRKLLMESAELGYPIAQSNLGVARLKGSDGFERDSKAGVRLMEQAARGGYGRAAGYLAREYTRGEFLEQDLDRAETLIQVATQEDVAEKDIKTYEKDLAIERQAQAKVIAALEDRPVYAGLAVSVDDAAFGWSYDQDSKEAARQRALAECRERNGANCAPKLILEGRGCAGYAYEQGGSPYGWGVNRDQAAAQSRAAQECRTRNGGNSCGGGKGWICNTRSTRDLTVVFEAENVSGAPQSVASGSVCPVEIMQFCENWFGGRVSGTVMGKMIISDFSKTVSYENCGVNKDSTYAHVIGWYKGKWDSSRGQNHLNEEQKSMVKKMLFAHREKVQAKYPECGDRGTRLLIFTPEKKENHERVRKSKCTTSLEAVRSNRKGEFKQLCVE
ncbi:DUF4189 domain-containing protein [Roseibium polysiphoniae]|uniref:DUF4189 domain-containing protein n=1 Tax=Roseibium polysiphoniae TaxID=2571221 RepID=A0ABR9CAA4_9HYPH|nr:DUF4189 domain-containing protein [Roseibium polysiphoniae]MBD8876484.1 DUF4189 domain-containing protein [Roseibium polysiphoniae]